MAQSPIDTEIYAARRREIQRREESRSRLLLALVFLITIGAGLLAAALLGAM